MKKKFKKKNSKKKIPKKNSTKKFKTKIQQKNSTKKINKKNKKKKFKKKISHKKFQHFSPIKFASYHTHRITLVVSHLSYHTPTLLPVEYDEYWCDKHNTGI